MVKHFKIVSKMRYNRDRCSKCGTKGEEFFAIVPKYAVNEDIDWDKEGLCINCFVGKLQYEKFELKKEEE